MITSKVERLCDLCERVCVYTLFTFLRISHYGHCMHTLAGSVCGPPTRRHDTIRCEITIPHVVSNWPMLRVNSRWPPDRVYRCQKTRMASYGGNPLDERVLSCSHPNRRRLQRNSWMFLTKARCRVAIGTWRSRGCKNR